MADEELPHYARRSAEDEAQAAFIKHDAERIKAKWGVAVGIFYIVVGVVLTLYSLGSRSSIVWIVWGPVVYGIYRVWRGLRE